MAELRDVKREREREREREIESRPTMTDVTQA